MLIISLLAFFAVIFLLATITVAVAWLAFIKRKAEEREAASGEEGVERAPLLDELDSGLFRDDRLSSLNFWDSVLARFDFVEILKTRISQAQLDWSVGRVTLAMLLIAMVMFLVVLK